MTDIERRPTGAFPTVPNPAAPAHPAYIAYAVAPTTSPAVIPQKPVLEKKTYSSAMSYIGITRRFTRWARHATVPAATPLKTPSIASRLIHAIFGILAWCVALCAVFFMYVVVTMWYVIVLGVFGIFMFPWRLHRRSQRRSQHLAEAQLAATQALLAQQQRR